MSKRACSLLMNSRERSKNRKKEKKKQQKRNQRNRNSGSCSGGSSCSNLTSTYYAETSDLFIFEYHIITSQDSFVRQDLHTNLLKL